MLSIFWGGGFGVEGAGVVLAGRREGFHGDPAGSAIPGVQITPSRAVRAS